MPWDPWPQPWGSVTVLKWFKLVDVIPNKRNANIQKRRYMCMLCQKFPLVCRDLNRDSNRDDDISKLEIHLASKHQEASRELRKETLSRLRGEKFVSLVELSGKMAESNSNFAKQSENHHQAMSDLNDCLNTDVTVLETALAHNHEETTRRAEKFNRMKKEKIASILELSSSMEKAISDFAKKAEEHHQHMTDLNNSIKTAMANLQELDHIDSCI